MTEKEVKSRNRRKVILKFLIDVPSIAILTLFCYLLTFVPYNRFHGLVSNWQLVGIMTICIVFFVFIVFGVAATSILLDMMVDVYFATEVLAEYETYKEENIDLEEEVEDGKTEQESQETV